MAERKDKNMTIEQLVPIIVMSLRESEWPGHDGNFFDCDFPGLLQGTWYHPRWLAQMVVGIVEERAKRIHHSAEEVIIFDSCEEKETDIKDAYRELGLSQRDWTWLKGKVGK
mgnify:CR=1 FL=1